MSTQEAREAWKAIKRSNLRARHKEDCRTQLCSIVCARCDCGAERKLEDLIEALDAYFGKDR